jgi:hypothetical protein
MPAEEDGMHEHLHALAVHAYYVGEHDTGRRACERLLAMPDLPADLEQQTRSNRTWYTRPLGDLAPVQMLRIDCEPAWPGWTLFNPTIAANGNTLVGIVRSSNYRIVEGRYVIPPEDGETIRTKNILCKIDADLTGISDPRTVSGPDYPANDYPVVGLEDCRLRRTAVGWGVSATARNVNGWDGRCRQVVADLDIDSARLSGLKVLESGELQVHEKNWMPIAGRSAWLYAANHNGHAVTVDEDTTLPGAYQILQRAPAPAIARGFRGGGQLVAHRGGFLGVIHEVADLNGRRVYEHRFAWWDDALALRRLSLPFAFRETQAIEFAAGMAAIGDDVFVSFGVRDEEAWVAKINRGDVWSIMEILS